MSAMVTEQLRQLAETLTDLKTRVRHAVAGEVGRAVAEAVGEVLVAVLGGQLTSAPRWSGRTPHYDPFGPGSANEYGPDGWDDPDSPGWDPSYGTLRRPANEDDSTDDAVSTDDVVGPAALAVAIAASQWWLARRGSPWGAAGAGLAAGATLLAGGPLARTALAVLLAVHRLLAATDALGDGARTLDGL
jgi:hypothetical protein